MIKIKETVLMMYVFTTFSMFFMNVANEFPSGTLTIFNV